MSIWVADYPTHIVIDPVTCNSTQGFFTCQVQADAFPHIRHYSDAMSAHMTRIYIIPVQHRIHGFYPPDAIGELIIEHDALTNSSGGKVFVCMYLVPDVSGELFEVDQLLHSGPHSPPLALKSIPNANLAIETTQSPNHRLLITSVVYPVHSVDLVSRLKTCPLFDSPAFPLSIFSWPSSSSSSSSNNTGGTRISMLLKPGYNPAASKELLETQQKRFKETGLIEWPGSVIEGLAQATTTTQTCYPVDADDGSPDVLTYSIAVNNPSLEGQYINSSSAFMAAMFAFAVTLFISGVILNLFVNPVMERVVSLATNLSINPLNGNVISGDVDDALRRYYYLAMFLIISLLCFGSGFLWIRNTPSTYYIGLSVFGLALIFSLFYMLMPRREVYKSSPLHIHEILNADSILNKFLWFLVERKGFLFWLSIAAIFSILVSVLTYTQAGTQPAGFYVSMVFGSVFAAVYFHYMGMSNNMNDADA